MAGAIKASEDSATADLKGMPTNPGRDPKKSERPGKGSIGDTALMDALIIVALAWAFLIFLALSLRSHNI